ncbi:PIN domain-containing protein [Prosthecobacter sp. SYSU 5D2]|uniref:type II toxin-antitoxin system VapC family toxin n=1 Tax=Prosthecobacter sp. SYSU 5D2 TaxID=3134134 RepID=UPI0031FEC986
MNPVTIDASVWIAAQDTADVFCQQSREFLTACLTQGLSLHVPAYARVEVACALARKLRDPDQGQELTRSVFLAAGVQEWEMNAWLLTASLTLGTSQFLRGADALYAGTASLSGSTLVSWDKEHLLRAGGISPADWMTANRQPAP